LNDLTQGFTAMHDLGAGVVRDLSVSDLIKAAEMRRVSLGVSSALDLYDAWIAQNGEHPLLYAVRFNLSVLLTEVGELDRARAQLESAIIANPAFIPAYINLGRVYERIGSTSLAVMQWSSAVDRLAAVNGTAISHKTTALNQMARVLEMNNQDAAAEKTLRQSLELDPHQPEPMQHLTALRQRQCEWPVVAPWDQVTGERQLKGMSPLSLAAYTDDPMLQLAAAFNLNKDEIRAEHAGSAARRVHCVHCRAGTEDVRTNIVRCSGCARWLLVRDHYSRRFAAYMGVNVDAEAPGELPPIREIYS